MTLVTLVKKVSEAIRAAVSRYELISDENGLKPVTVYEQYIPPEIFDRDETGEYHPLILVSLETVEDDRDTHNNAYADLGITFAVYGEEDRTWQDLLNVIDTVRLELLARPVIGGYYRLMRPLTTEILERQPVPFWYGYMTARYYIYAPNEERSIAQ